MSPAWIAAIVAIIVCLLGIGGHAIATAWWASKITTTLETVGKQLTSIGDKFEKHLETYLKERYTADQAKEDHAKRDDLVAKMWMKYDNLRDEIAVIRSKVDNHIENGKHHQ